jgi:hypothetical protein
MILNTEDLRLLTMIKQSLVNSTPQQHQQPRGCSVCALGTGLVFGLVLCVVVIAGWIHQDAVYHDALKANMTKKIEAEMFVTSVCSRPNVDRYARCEEARLHMNMNPHKTAMDESMHDLMGHLNPFQSELCGDVCRHVLWKTLDFMVSNLIYMFVVFVLGVCIIAYVYVSVHSYKHQNKTL